MYAIRNPLEFAGYGQYFWGLTASEGTGWTTQRVRGIERPLFDYVAPGAAVASLPFAPEIVLPTVQHLCPVVLMCENYRSGLLWRLTRAYPYVVTGLRRAGFTNGWL